MKNVSLLARLFGRSQSSFVSAIFSNAIGQPLLVHPQIGEQLLGAYLHGAVEARPPARETLALAAGRPASDGEAEVAPRHVAVLNVSGALVNRYEGDFCDPGPLSYAELRAAYDSAQADSKVEAIVLRIESPGGMGGGLFDLADHIRASRDGKPVYAAIDDYAYSAAFALACAASEVWITRTGGAGSVGVIAYHVDQSSYDAKLGVKVTAVHAGAHKNDFSPHQPLSDDARAWLQTRMEDMRQLFAQTVADARGLELQTVLDTEAQVYQGQAAVDIGFADRVGTFYELIAQIKAGSHEAVAPASSAVAASAAATVATDELDAPDAASAVAAPPADAAPRDVLAALRDAQLRPDLVAALVAANVGSDQIDTRIEHARQIADICAAARLESCAAGYVERNVAVETVRAELIDAVADDPNTQVRNTLPSDAGLARRGNAKLDPQTIYEQRRAAASTQLRK